MTPPPPRPYNADSSDLVTQLDAIDVMMVPVVQIERSSIESIKAGGTPPARVVPIDDSAPILERFTMESEPLARRDSASSKRDEVAKLRGIVPIVSPPQIAPSASAPAPQPIVRVPDRAPVAPEPRLAAQPARVSTRLVAATLASVAFTCALVVWNTRRAQPSHGAPDIAIVAREAVTPSLRSTAREAAPLPALDAGQTACTMSIRSSVYGASIWVNGTRRGAAPMTVTTPCAAPVEIDIRLDSTLTAQY